MTPFAIAVVDKSLIGPAAAPGLIVTGVPTILINGDAIAAMTVSVTSVHGEEPPHTSFVSMGSAFVFANGDPVAFSGCETSCGHPILNGNFNMVFLGSL